MRSRNRRTATLVLFGVAAAISGCGTPKEKTAPCKRPANVLSFGPETPRQPTSDCGPMHPVNTYPVTTGAVNAAPDTAIDAIDDLTADQEPG